MNALTCRVCGAEMVVVDAHFDIGCSQQLFDYECPSCGEDGYSETCGEFQPDDEWDESL